MRILISGSSGFLGSALVRHLGGAGHQVVRLRRGPMQPAEAPGSDQRFWDPATGTLPAPALAEVEAVLHLGGESIVGRWTPAKKQRLHDSRVGPTRLLAATLAGLPQPPQVFLCASAIGYYGDRGEMPLDEQAGAGQGFLADLCQQWEAATSPAAAAGIRTVNLRIGVVLGAGGGALPAMLPLFKWGLGGRLGHGRQYWSWIALEDVLGAIQHLLTTAGLSGPVNLTAPQPVTNRQFTAALARALHRPAIFPAPGWALHLALGEMADSLLASQRVLPRKLSASGYRFQYETLAPALARALG